MDDTTDPRVTALLQRVRAGDEGAGDALFDLVHAELRGLARAAFQGQAEGHTLQPTAILNEAWMKMAGHLGSLVDRRHFFVVASRAMRQVLTDYARGSAREKRGGSKRPVTLNDELFGFGDRGLDWIALNDSLEELASLDERQARVVELRFFGALTIEETAQALGVSHTTVETDWAMARAWLRRELAG